MKPQSNSYVLKLNELSQRDIELAGAKAANLGELLRAGLPVPAGFVLTTAAFDRFLGANGFTPDCVERLRLELKNLQDRNMAKASFEERLDLVARLGIKVYPSEDLKSRRIKCGLDIRGIQKTGEQDEFAKVVFGRPCRSKGRTFSTSFALSI